MKILIMNAGSSSLKYQLVDMDGEKNLAKGIVDRIGIDGGKLKQKCNGKEYVVEQEMKNHTEAIEQTIKALTDPEYGALTSMDEVAAVGHRVVHGGEFFTKSALIDETVKDAIRANIPLGPLHNPANLMGIEACESLMPNTPGVAVFDTAFHQTMPKKTYLYAIPMDYYERLKVRRYGFHGSSHRYVSKRACEFLGLDYNNSRIITCHIGNGSSVAAIQNGKSVDTSMGFTPLEGVPMGTRSGAIDPAIIQFIANAENKTVDEVTAILNKESGLIGITGFSSDARDVEDAYMRGDERAILAYEMLSMSIRKYIGAYAAVMGGVDAIVFTAGIGENDSILRRLTIQNLEYLGAKLDLEKNETRKEAIISTDDSKVKVAIIPTDEEIVIARDTLAIVTGEELQ